MPRAGAVSENEHPLQLCMILLRTISHRLAGAVKRSVEQICKIYSNAVRASNLPLEPKGGLERRGTSAVPECGTFRNRHDRSSESVASGVCHAITIALLTCPCCLTSMSDMAMFRVKNRDFQRSPADWMHRARQGDTIVIVSPEGPPLTP